MGQKTPLYRAHVDAGAKIVDFGGWDMPVHYGSQLDEHHIVRRDAGMFDVSHMRVVDVHGDNARALLSYLLANNVDKLQQPGKALYTCMLNEQGGIIDDLIVYHMRDDWFRLVVNAGTAQTDIEWINQQAKRYTDLDIVPRPELGMIAVQGPQGRAKALQALTAVLGREVPSGIAQSGPFFGAEVADLFVATTGYTGEDGFEITMPNEQCVSIWTALVAAGVEPCGLGSRDTLRLEAGMNLYGSDMDETTTPLESGLSWTVGWQPPTRDFVGREVLDAQRQSGPGRKLVGLVLLQRGVLRSHQQVFCGQNGEGEITSGTFSPTLSKAIALARVPSVAKVGDKCEVEIRNKKLEALIVKYPFVRNGQSCL